jgi:hypothetical protein
LKFSRRRTVFGPGGLMNAPGIWRIGVTVFMAAVLGALLSSRRDQGSALDSRSSLVAPAAGGWEG